MNKKEFLSLLNKKLSKLPKQEVKESLTFYSEMIDDRIEEGLTEEEAVLNVGDIDEIVNQIVSEIPKDYEDKKPLTKWEIILLAIGSPIWFPLVLVGFVILWSLILVLWAIEIPFLIFSYLSKFLIVGCEKSTKWVAKITKYTFNCIGDVFKN